MSLADEIEKLQALREQGALTDHEFARAKAALLEEPSSSASASASSASSASSGSSSSPSGSRTSNDPSKRRGETDNDETLNTILKWSVIIYVGLSVVGTAVGALVFFNVFYPLINGAK